MTSEARPWPFWAWRGAVLAGLWLVFAGTDPASWLIGLPAVAFATWASGRLGSMQAWRLSPSGLIRFVALFTWESLRGGLDVAQRTLGPELKVAPGFINYACRLPAGRPQRLFASCVSLLPGTLVAELQDERMLIHLLDRNVTVDEELKKLEDIIAAVFSLQLEHNNA